ncbi:DUF58 domain-containing protein [Gryllotalpicola ginsengisoli]|uniref:DUF58 domain-containing protein n=1 Tax=Gryllotalpicola ginsengisoli TaxID=444608 RepID=UPI00040CE49F|nr:DUF58 domain-containing protein [Gryllotalpicola ginsengisoli]
MSAPPPPAAPRWRLTAVQLGAVVAGLLLAAAGAVTGRADVVVLGLPLLALAAWAWDRRPPGTDGGRATDDAVAAAPEVSLTAGHGPVEGALGYWLRLVPPEGVEAVQLRTRPLGDRARLDVLAVRPGRPVEVHGTVPVPHSGPQTVLIAEWRLVATGGALLTDVSPELTVERVISPPFAPLSALPLPRRLTGLTGTRDSSRPGDGGDFHDIDRFRPGDRLRRIDWKATARLARQEGELYVRRTLAQSDTTVVVVVDSAVDVGENVADWVRHAPLTSGVTSLDIARSAASSIAAGYLRAGDRVGFADLSAPRRAVPPGAGSRHLSRLLTHIAATGPVAERAASRRPPLVTGGAQVFLLSAFLDAHPANTALVLAAAGHRVVAVDVLPAPATDELTPERRLAHRVLMMERDDQLAELAGGGVDLLRWGHDVHDTGRDAALLALARPQRLGGVIR